VPKTGQAKRMDFSLGGLSKKHVEEIRKEYEAEESEK